MKILNNLVTEILSITEFPRKPHGKWTFTNPRDGWVFITSTADTKGAERVHVALDSALLVHQATAPDTLEMMSYLPAGEYIVQVESEGNPALKNLNVRAIPELIFCKFQYDPHIPEYGSYDWNLLEKHVLPNVNTIVGSGDEKHQPYVEEWKKQGKKWIVEVPATPYFQGWDADEAYRCWSETAGFKNPLLDGIIVDDFDGGDDKRYPPISESIRRIRQDERFRDKVLYPYCGSMYGSKLSEDFIRSAIDSGYRFTWERYLREQADQETAAEFLNSSLSQELMYNFIEVQPYWEG